MSSYFNGDPPRETKIRHLNLNVSLTLSETTSIPAPFIWESPPPRGWDARMSTDSKLKAVFTYNMLDHRQPKLGMRINYSIAILLRNVRFIEIVWEIYLYANYSQTCIKWPCIKRSPSIKRSVTKVPKISPLKYSNYINVASIKRSPLLSGRGHLSKSPSEGISIVLTCIKRSLHKRKPYEHTLNVVILNQKQLFLLTNDREI